MIRILVIAPYESMLPLIQDTFAKYEGSDVALHSLYAVGVKFIADTKFDYDVVIARGATAEALRMQHAELPVVNLQVTGYDVIRSIHQAKRGNDRCRIAIIGSENMIFGVRGILDILGGSISCYSVSAEEDTDSCVARAMLSGVDVIIGGAMTVAIADKRGCATVLIESGGAALVQAFDEAIRTARIARQERANAERFRTLMDYTYEGIIAVDSSGTITACNRTAQRALRVQAGQAIGKPLGDVFPTGKMNQVLETGAECLGELEKINNNLMAVNFVPIKIGGGLVGAVATFQNVDRIQELEGEIRQKIHSKGLAAKYFFKDCIGTSAVWLETVDMAHRFSRVDSNILLAGETGTGKELLAQSIHNDSNRSKGPFVAVNCAALPENLLESELFGYVEGAFTGAAKGGKPGLFELAHRGTIFLDEVSEIPVRLQGRLLRVIQEREVMRLGHDRVKPIDVRILCATNRNLHQATEQGAFRRDLLYRLDVLSLSVPPLRARREDIGVLFRYFLKMFAVKLGAGPLHIAPAAEIALTAYDWPGNVRELGNVCERIVVLRNGDEVTRSDVMRVLASERLSEPAPVHSDSRPLSLKEAEMQAIQLALKACDNNKVAAAELLGISRATLWRKLNGMAN